MGSGEHPLMSFKYKLIEKHRLLNDLHPLQRLSDGQKVAIWIARWQKYIWLPDGKACKEDGRNECKQGLPDGPTGTNRILIFQSLTSTSNINYRLLV
jgi:hypothetical protein